MNTVVIQRATSVFMDPGLRRGDSEGQKVLFTAAILV